MDASRSSKTLPSDLISALESFQSLDTLNYEPFYEIVSTTDASCQFLVLEALCFFWLAFSVTFPSRPYKKPLKAKGKDTGRGTNICITKQGFREARKLKQGALYLYVGNGVRAQVEAIGSYDLVLPNGLVICLDNCHYAPSILIGVVSVHYLVENGFVQRFTDFGISVSKNNVHYFNVIPSNGIYEIDMHNLVPNVNSIYNVSTKRAKHNLDSTYLWHCRLAHIKLSNKHTIHLTHPQHNGLVLKGENRTLLDMVRSMMNLTTLSLSFWDYALESATRILNMVPTKKVDKTPYELWYGKVPNLSYLKVWGCEALVKRDTPDKLQQRSVKCIFIGYPKETMLLLLLPSPPEYKISMLEVHLYSVADIRAIRILISITAYYDYEIWKMDIKTAFLNGYLNKDIYMVQPKGFVDPNHPRKYASFKDPFMVLSKHQESGIKDLMRKSKGFREAAFILRIKIYRDSQERLIGVEDLNLNFEIEGYCDDGIET
ncbi:retrotransposon protein, putative, ty1-copia subclass [Tanacetum coccineum]